jgi:Pseudouridine synthase
VLYDPTDLIWRGGTPFEAMAVRTTILSETYVRPILILRIERDCKKILLLRRTIDQFSQNNSELTISHEELDINSLLRLSIPAVQAHH